MPPGIPTVDIGFALSSSPGARPQEARGRVVNAYVEPLGDGTPIWRRAPGTRAFGTTAHTGFRGAFVNGAILYSAFSGKLVKYTSAGGASAAVGDLAGTTKVFFARNNKAGTPDQVVVTENGAFSFTSSGVSAFADADLPQPNAVCFLGGYFIFTIGDGRMFSTGLNAVTVSALDFATAESKPDTLLRPVPFGGFLYACGDKSIEIWPNTANPTGFPFSWQYTIPRGLLAAHAITGFEDGVGVGIFFVADNNTVQRLNGYTPEKVSPPDLDRRIEALSDKTTLEMSSYVSQGHTFIELSCAAWTWVLDVNNMKWHERDSYGIARHRLIMPINAFNKWIGGDTKAGNLIETSGDVLKDIDEPLRFRLESIPVGDFPNGVQVARADFLFTPGTGSAVGADPVETDPQVEISFTDDGVKWSSALVRKLGRQQKGEQRVYVLNMGIAGPQGRRWRLDVTSGVYVGLMRGKQSADIRAV